MATNHIQWNKATNYAASAGDDIAGGWYETEREWHEKAEQLCGLPIEDIIKEQNMPRLVEHWVESKVMSPSAYLAAAVYYFLFGMVDQKKAVANQTVVDLFKVSKSNLH